jgi:hypothetical protein
MTRTDCIYLLKCPSFTFSPKAFMFSGFVTSTAKKNVLQRCIGSVAHRAENIFSLQSLLALLLDLGDCREADVCELGVVAHAYNPNLPGD